MSCFRTDHCMEGDVCLADGGCSPLHFHMWNPRSFDHALEFGVLAESCGLPPGADTHPYRQSLQDASPW